MSQLKRIDRVIGDIQSQVQGDISALLGSPLTFSSPVSLIMSKKDYFADLKGAQVIAHIDIDGDIQGVGGLIINQKAAVLLGGTLIMLPDAELDEVVTTENYTEDIADSYGEIANLIVGACSKVFEESYPQNCRFIRKIVESIKPAKIDPSNDEVLPNVSYYRVCFNIKLGEKELGEMSLVLPATPFELDGTQQENDSVDESAKNEQKEIEQDAARVVDTTEKQHTQSVPVEHVVVDTVKNIKQIDKILASCFAQMGGELGMLLGVEAQVMNMQLALTTKEDFLADLMGKHVLSNLSIHGEENKFAYLCLSLGDAIHLGGVLIMLPPSELEVVVQRQEFDEDAKDAFGEIANIITGVYTAQFGENHHFKTRFIREDLEAFAPAKVDVDSDDLLVNQTYYIHSMDIEVNGKALGKMQFLLSALDFGLIESKSEKKLERDVQDVSAVDQESNPLNAPQSQGFSQTSSNNVGTDPYEIGGESFQGTATRGDVSGEQTLFGNGGRTLASSDTKVFDILLVSNNQDEAAKISSIAEAKGLAVGCVGFGENVQRYLSPNLKAIYLVMSEVNEQIFGLAIKLSSGTSSPLIAVGPGWTRSTVIKAVKYGVGDILLTPADSADIESCLLKNTFV